MKKQAMWLSPLLVVVATPVAVISSCATTAENSEFQKTVDQLFNEAKLSLNFNNPIMSEDIFNKYKDQYQEIKKGFKLENQSDLKLDWQITKITEEEKTIKVSILVTDGAQNATQTITLTKSFASSHQFYIDGVYNQIRQNLQLKPEYEKMKLVDLFSKTKTNQDIMDLFAINDYLDVKIELNFLSQTIDRDEPKLKFNVLVKNQADNQFVPPSNVFQPAYSFKNLDLIQPVTLLLQSDLEKEHDKDSKIPNGSYFGKTFIIKDQASDILVFNRNLVTKKITEKLDFSTFKTVEFGSNALLNGNDITALNFDLSGTVKNLKADLFKSNAIEKVELPANVENFNISAFDENVNIINLNQVPDIKTFYDDQNKIIYLNKVVYKTDQDLNQVKEQIKQMLNLVARSQSQDRKTINVNKIVLPNFNFETPYDLNISTQTIEFNSQAINKNLKADQKPLIEKFETDLSRWKIKTINIPASVILINESNLPSSSDENPVTITRELNSNVLDLVKTTTLDLSKSLAILKDLGYDKTTLIENLASNSMLLDQLFYGFSTPNESVKKLTKILVKNPNTNNTAFLSMSNFSYYAKFFTQNTTKDGVAKTIEIDQSIEKIEMSDFSSFRSSFKGYGVSVVRKKPTSFTWIDENGTFKLSDFQKDKSNQDGYKYLSGLEDQIKSIDTSNATKIDNHQFYGLDFSLSATRAPLQIDLNSVTSIGDYAFYNVDGLTYKMDQSSKWTTVGTYAFYYADLANTIDLSGLTTISDYAFYGNSNVTGVTLSTSLTSIGNSAFYSNKITTLNSLPTTLTSIGDYAFAYNDLTSRTKTALDLSNVEKIGQSAFASNANLAAVTVGTKLKDISNYAFQNTGLTSFNFSNVTTIGSYAFANTKLTGELDLTKVSKIGSSAFEQSQEITGLKLKQDAEIENGAFRNLTKLNKVENFNFTKYNFDDLFDSNQVEKINFNDNTLNLETFFHYETSSKNLDLSSITEWKTEHTNKFKLFLKTHKEFKDVTLPKVNQQDTNLMNLLQNATTIEKLIWNTDNNNANKTINFSLSSNVKSLDESFVLGAMEIPNYTFSKLQIDASKNQKLNLNTVTKVGDYAFGANSGINEFTSTTNIKEIGSNSFGYQSKLELSADVKMQDSSFNASTNQALIPPTVKQSTRFSKSEFLTIYDPNTKIIDFTKADLNGHEFYDSSKWNKYYNIGDYLLTGEVTKVILPEVYVIWKGFVNNLGQVQEIVFQSTNQSIAKDAFSGTTVVKKPQQNQTNILFDGDNFFSKTN